MVGVDKSIEAQQDKKSGHSVVISLLKIVRHVTDRRFLETLERLESKNGNNLLNNENGPIHRRFFYMLLKYTAYLKVPLLQENLQSIKKVVNYLVAEWSFQ